MPLKQIISNLRPKRPARPAGEVRFVGAGPGDADLLTVKALRALQEADVVIHDGLVPAQIVQLAQSAHKFIPVGKKGFGHHTPQSDINARIVENALRGHRVVRLKGGDPTVFARLDEEIEALEEHGIRYEIVPGITAASASLAAIGQSLTKRGRNASARILTGHDMKGFADHDWRALAQSGEVAAIYMGKRAARFIQGRLLMHGADPTTPVTLVENASRADQSILATNLLNLPDVVDQANPSGPALMLWGLAPRDAAAHPVLQQELA
ncbi:MAG: uroporphyrinogen-III C-methyltransferase [Pelagimonas sp.]|uniref:uroporphyrinogen-III C-methyltransferase n=1 Tax=Pelagimonas sp. TaxID=2073170 RepID=UPI003D6C430D